MKCNLVVHREQRGKDINEEKMIRHIYYMSIVHQGGGIGSSQESKTVARFLMNLYLLLTENVSSPISH